MVKIKDFDMPKSCNDCMLGKSKWSDKSITCCLLNEDVSTHISDRHKKM